MNKEAIFTFIKKNVVSLSCALVAIIAVVLIFYPLGGFLDTLQNEANDLAGNYQSLTGFIKTRKLPMNDPNQTDPGTLTVFPNDATIAVGNKAVERFKAASDQMLKDVVDLNKKGHAQLVPDELPVEHFEHTPFFFAQVYKLVLSTDPSVHGPTDPAPVPPATVDSNLASAHAFNLQNDVLHGGLPPTPDQIKLAGDELWKNSYEPDIITMNGKPTNMQDLSTRWHAENDRLPQKMKALVAKNHKIYVEHDAFTINPLILPDVKAQITDIWYAQMQLWMQQDLCAGIAEANANSTNIMDAKVKRLISIQVPSAPMYTFPPASAATAGGGGPTNQPATGDDKTAIPPIYTTSVTGRYSNGMYDSVRFILVIDVDSSHVNDVIQSISNNRMITITSENQYALDPDAEASRGYLYGSGSAVRLQLEGEELFMRDWTKDLMPEGIKMALGLIQPKPGTVPNNMGSPGMGGGGMMMPPGGPGGPGMPGLPPMR